MFELATLEINSMWRMQNFSHTALIQQYTNSITFNIGTRNAIQKKFV